WIDLRDAHPLAYRRFAGRNPFERHANPKNFWYDYDEAAQLLYVNYSGVSDMPGETVAAFFDKVFAFADAHPVRKFVLDVRNNGGGNNYLNRPIIKGLIARGNSIARKGTFFTLIGRSTFSAAQNLVDALETYTDVTFVGEPTGGSPNSFGDALPLTLPNSRLTILVASVWWQDVDPRDQRLSIPPEIAAQPTAAAEREGRDVAMEAVRNYVAEPSLAKIVRDALGDGGRAKAEAAIRGWRADPRHEFLTGDSALVNLGVALYGENRAADAMTVFELNAQFNPDSWLAHNSLGRAYAAAKNVDAARAEFARALQIRPDAPETLAALDRLNAH
ncbi:MAG TPA: hypothetical protein VJ853_11175, partial [Thermoanaerobaculia bacterium]|nr:hypothetical protein [Thermoanaerobaculia bacterium]